MARTLSILVAGVLAAAAAVAGQAQTSAALAKQLTGLLAGRHADAWVARDPADPQRFIAALHVPGSQLLVVSTPYANPAVIESRLARQDYRQAYVDLQTASARAGKFFVQDIGADGLPSERAGAVDIVYRDGTERTILNGDWKAQHIDEAEYTRRCRDAEARYAGMLTALVNSLTGAGAEARAGAPPPSPR